MKKVTYAEHKRRGEAKFQRLAWDGLENSISHFGKKGAVRYYENILKNNTFDRDPSGKKLAKYRLKLISSLVAKKRVKL